MSTVASDTTLKRRRPAHHPVAQGHDKKRKKQQCVAAAAAVAAALLEVRHVGIPLVSNATGRPCESIRLEAGRLYAIGRGAGRCDFLLPDPRVSNLHCRILFDGSQRKVFVFHAGSRPNDSFVSRERVGEESEAAPCGALSRVFANGVECRQGSAVALFAGDEVLLVCGGDGKCRSGNRIGFAIRRIVVLDEEEVVSPGSDDPRAVKERLNLFSKEPATDPGGEPELPNVLPINNSDTICNLPSMRCRLPHPLTHVHPAEKVVSSEIDGKGACVSAHAGNLSQRGNKYLENADRITSNLNRVPPETGPCFNSTANDENRRSFCPPPGMNFCLNRLESIGQGSFGCSSEISLAELIYPVESIAQIFIATFTCDIEWFLSYCRIPDHLPVTIACHDTDRCWSSSPEQRTLVPYPEFPMLVVVYPPFPGIIAFACHHPKLLVFQREDRIRVIITSANSVAK
ncbi:uncharacterized protein LOC120295643 [Eucalyptus grandis]|uniref:uncharacterized protein LOC120295643 n=1 Tax=Eucalyptus grandis TaxID=71139 RepID=UPI00192E8D03|nr:uncharacterized protein LOC120295643 [Eucalyptus grandis]